MRRDKKDCLAAKASYDHARQAEYEDVIRRPRPETWPARMPAYAGTVLCPDRRYRGTEGEKADGQGENVRRKKGMPDVRQKAQGGQQADVLQLRRVLVHNRGILAT